VTVEPPPGAFLQATKRGEQAMRAGARLDRRCARLADFAGWARCRWAGRQARAVRERQAASRRRGGGAPAGGG
jgi:hypothetical protein